MAGCLTFFSSKIISRPDDVSNLLVSSSPHSLVTSSRLAAVQGLASCTSLSLEPEDYLIGLCDMSNELVRL
jgi:hypothetical protein